VETDELRNIGEQSGKSVKSALKKKSKAIWWEGFAEKEGFKPRMKSEG